MTNIIDETRIALGGVGDFAANLASPSIRLGVTGLSRAGKTVFITSLVHALTTNARLPLLTAQSKNRIRRAWLEPQPDLGLPRFAYEDHLAALTGPERHWPESTRRLSQLRLTLEVETRGMFGGERDPREIHIDIIDYPGEWLLDLPLMKQTYAQWSAATLKKHPTIPLEQADAPADETLALAAAQMFTKHGQGTPGRFQMPGDLEGSPLLIFAPLKLKDGYIKPNSLAALMSRRYEAYVARVVKPFYRDHLSRLDRQIVLVDTLTALNTGTASELSDALTDVLASFRQGANTFTSRIFGKRVERILFAATKADLLHHTSHDRLERILGKLVDTAATRAQFAGAQIAVTAIAAVRATKEARVRDKGEELACITGTPELGEKIGNQTFDGIREAAIFPGDLPTEAERAFDGSLEGAVSFIRFRPPANGLPHIRLDKALEFLIGDRLL